MNLAALPQKPGVTGFASYANGDVLVFQFAVQIDAPNPIENCGVLAKI